MKWIMVIIGLFLAVFLEATVFQIPFVLLVLLVTLIFIPKPWIILLSIPAGFFLDSALFRPLGESSLFFASMMGLAFAYGRKFELRSVGFVVFASSITSLLYFLLFGLTHIIYQLFCSIGVAVILFVVITVCGEKFSSSPFPPHKTSF